MLTSPEAKCFDNAVPVDIVQMEGIAPAAFRDERKDPVFGDIDLAAKRMEGFELVGLLTLDHLDWKFFRTALVEILPVDSCIACPVGNEIDLAGRIDLVHNRFEVEPVAGDFPCDDTQVNDPREGVVLFLQCIQPFLIELIVVFPMVTLKMSLKNVSFQKFSITKGLSHRSVKILNRILSLLVHQKIRRSGRYR